MTNKYTREHKSYILSNFSFFFILPIPGLKELRMAINILDTHTDLEIQHRNSNIG